MQGYGKDLAYIHDRGHGDFALNAAPGLLQILRRHGISGGLVVDLGCGSGIWARELGRAGYDVLGVDISPAMIELARRKAPAARFVTASLLKVKLPPCDAVTAMGECVNYCFDENSGKRQLVRLFRRVYDALRPGGVFVFDSLGPGQVVGSKPRTAWRQGEDWAVVSEAEENRRRKLLIRRITSFRKVGKHYRRSEEVHRVRLYESAELAVELRRAGFRVRVLRGYGQFRLRRAHAVFVAWKALRELI